jgi:hypothetical protein
MPSGVTTTTAKRLIKSVGVVYRDISAVSTVMGATAGPPTVRPIQTMRNLGDEIDGVTNPIDGMDVYDVNNLEVTFTLAELTPTTLAEANPGSTSVTATGVTTITPPDTSELIAANLDNFKIVWPLGVDGILTLNIPKAIVTAYGFTSERRSLGKLQLTVQGRVDLAAAGSPTTDTPTFEWVIDPST